MRLWGIGAITEIRMALFRLMNGNRGMKLELRSGYEMKGEGGKSV